MDTKLNKKDMPPPPVKKQATKQATKEEIEAIKEMLSKVFSSARAHTATTLPENEAAMYNLITFKSKVFQMLNEIPLGK